MKKNEKEKKETWSYKVNILNVIGLESVYNFAYF